MSYSNQQIAKLIASLLKSKQTPIFQKGTTSSTGINKELTVRLTNGKVVRALAWNVSTPGQVTVFWDAQNKRYVAWKEETSSLKRKTILASRKTRPDEKKYLWEYFIKVLQPSSIEGFDNDQDLNLDEYEPYSFVNRGDIQIVMMKNGDDILYQDSNTIKTIDTSTFSREIGLGSVGGFYFETGNNTLNTTYQLENAVIEGDSITVPFAFSLESIAGSSGVFFGNRTLTLQSPGWTYIDENLESAAIIATTVFDFPGGTQTIVFTNRRYLNPSDPSFETLNYDLTYEDTLTSTNTATYISEPSGDTAQSIVIGTQEAYLNISRRSEIWDVTGTFSSETVTTPYRLPFMHSSDTLSNSFSKTESFTSTEINFYQDATLTNYLRFTPYKLWVYVDDISIYSIEYREYTEIKTKNDYTTPENPAYGNQKVICPYPYYSVASIVIDNNVYKISDNSDGFNFNGSYFWLCLNVSLIDGENTLTVTQSNFGVPSFSSQRLTKTPANVESTRTKTALNASITTDQIDHVVSNYYERSFDVTGDIVDIYVMSGNTTLRYTGTITSTNIFSETVYNIPDGSIGNYQQRSVVTSFTVNIDLESMVDEGFFCWTNRYSNRIYVIPSENHTSSILNYLDSGSTNSSPTGLNVYKLPDGTLELSVAEIPTTTTPETLRTDIYRFNTSTLKWERRPNAITPVSPLTSTSEFVSYHPTPSNSRKKRNRPPRS